MGKIIHDEQNGYEFISDRDIKYSLYEGKSINGNTTSDMIFVMCDTEADLDEVIGNRDYIYVGWFFGATCMKDDGFRIDAQDIINNMVNKYEDEHPKVVNYFCPTDKDGIKVGDEVIVQVDRIGFVTGFDVLFDRVYVVTKDGWADAFGRSFVKKTGRHFDEIENVLRQMRKGDKDDK